MKNIFKSLAIIALAAVIGFSMAACDSGDEGTTTVSVTGVTLNKNTLSLNVGDSETLNATVAPDNATNKAVTWATSNAAIATVSNGTVTAVASGTATITVTTADGGKTDTCSVYAIFIDPNKTPITTAEVVITAPVYGGVPVTAISGEEEHFTAGTITWSPNDNPFKPGTEYTASVTLTAKSNYTFTAYTTAAVNGQPAEISNITGGTVTLSYKFPATSTKKVTAITIKSPPNNFNYTHGDTLDLTGLVVTLTYDDTTTEDVAVANFTAKGITANPSNGDKLARSMNNDKPITVSYGSLIKTPGNLTVNAKNASDVSINEISEQTYTGSEIKPVITVKDGEETLTLNDDYTVSYSNNTNAGNAAVTVNFTGNYTGSSKTVNFTINKANPVTTWPTAASITYGSALSASALSGGANITPGVFAWTAPITIPTVTNSGYSVTFTPTDTANYNTTTNTVSITVTPANLSGTITISPNSGVIVGVQLTANYAGSENVSYQWEKGTSNVGTNSDKYTPTARGSYTVTVSATNYNSKTSAAVTVNEWTAVSNSTFGTSTINAIAYGSNGSTVSKFVAGGYDGKMAYSTDGVTWTAVSNSTFGTSTIYEIAYGSNGSTVSKFVAVADVVSTSTDGVIWTTVSDIGLSRIAYGNGKFVTAGYESYYSTDGETWTAGYYSTSCRAIAYGSNGSTVSKFVAASDYSGMAYSTDGVTWTYAANTTFAREITAIAYGNGKFVAGSGNSSAYSTDGETWTYAANRVLESKYVVTAIAYGNGKFVAVGVGEMAYLEDD